MTELDWSLLFFCLIFSLSLNIPLSSLTDILKVFLESWKCRWEWKRPKNNCENIFSLKLSSFWKEKHQTSLSKRFYGKCQVFAKCWVPSRVHGHCHSQTPDFSGWKFVIWARWVPPQLHTYLEWPQIRTHVGCWQTKEAWNENIDYYTF